MSWSAELRARRGDLSLDVSLAGDVAPLYLTGPNGSGKTTLLKLLAGVLRPDAGRIEVQGRVLFDAGADVDLPPERRSVGYVPQGYGLFPHLTVLDNVAFGLRPTLGRAAARERAAVALAELGAAALAARMPRALSGGERQRVALARALCTDPALLLLDEPVAALDAAARRQMRGFLADRLRQRGRPTLFVTHDLRDLLGSDGEILVLEQGRVVQRGTLEELADAPATEFVAELTLAGALRAG